MDLLVIGLVALLASGLTLFSGFGLGTLLMPVFALFFPVPVAIAATAVVHLANNVFKLGLMARLADWGVAWRFGGPAALAALAGAAALVWVDGLPNLASYSIGARELAITPVKALIGTLIMAFALLELSRRFQRLALPPRWLPVGGLLSGFFGGLSGNQGALRSAFLLKAGLSKESFVATGIVSAVAVDCVRLLAYGGGFRDSHMGAARELLLPVLVATGSAFAGAFLGSRVLRKVTFTTVRAVVAAGMLMVGAGLATGLI